MQKASTYFNLARRLIEATKSGKISWEPEPEADGSAYYTQVSPHNIRIRRSNSRGNTHYADDTYDYFLGLIDQEGSLIEEYDDVEMHKSLTEDLVFLEANESAYKVTQTLFNLARGNAFKTDDVLADIFNKLDSF